MAGSGCGGAKGGLPGLGGLAEVEAPWRRRSEKGLRIEFPVATEGWVGDGQG